MTGTPINDIVEAAIHQLSSQKRIPGAYSLRFAEEGDAAQIVAIENAATVKFAQIPALAYLFGGDQVPVDDVLEWSRQGAICIVETDSRIIGFAAMHVLDSSLYIDEISVLPEVQGTGIGNLLIATVCESARELQRRGEAAARVSLTTYAEVPWNGPWYARRGFCEVPASEVGPGHVQELIKDAHERDLVRPGYRRCCMVWEAQGDPTDEKA